MGGPVLVQCEQDIVAHHRLGLGSHGFRVTVDVGIQRAQHRRLVQHRLVHALVVLIGRHGQQAQQQPIEQVEAGRAMGDRLVQVGAGTDQQAQDRLEDEHPDKDRQDGGKREIEGKVAQRNVVQEIRHRFPRKVPLSIVTATSPFCEKILRACR